MKKLLILSGILIISSGAYAVAQQSSTPSEEKEFQKAIKQFEDAHREQFGKITNPYHPWFKHEKFEFEDYSAGGGCEKLEILAKLFPKGTKKEYVDYILIDVGGAHSKKNSDKEGRFHYYYTTKRKPYIFMESKWVITVSFNDKNEVIEIETGPGSVYDYYEYCMGRGSDYRNHYKKFIGGENE